MLNVLPNKRPIENVSFPAMQLLIVRIIPVTGGSESQEKRGLL